MYDIWDSPAWWSLEPFTTMKDNLTFSFFIDWFNPFTNKTLGKTVLYSTIVMFCLNLLYNLQYQPENTYFAGITSPPYEPSVTTITALLDPIVEQLQHFYHGQVIHIYWHQAGIMKRVVLLPAIGDLLTIHKALGFAGVTSHHFCSFYTLHKSDIENLDSGAWKLWKGTEVIAVVEQWCQALTKKKQEFIFKKHSICWSSLHQLLYCDLV